MGLLDGIKTAAGNAAANYLKGGRTVGRVVRIAFRDADHDLGPGFRVDVEVLKSDAEGAEVGSVVTANVGFKYKQEALANMRRILAAIATSKGVGSGPEGRCNEGEAADRAKEFVGQEQPLTDAIVTMVGTTKINKEKGTPYTLYEAFVPNARDLDGLDDSVLSA
jgi:hypothetical protein